MPSLPEQLAARLALPLPGRLAQRSMEPELSYGRQFVPPLASTRQAAVAIAVYFHAGEWRVPLIVRPAKMSAHAGQISLPGGAVDFGESPREAAWRELYEELGVPQASLVELGSLTPTFVWVSNFYVTPWVAALGERPAFQLNAEEVDELIELPLSVLSEDRRERMTVERRKLQFSAPCWVWQGHRIWGATSMILAELGAILREMHDE